MTFHLAAGAHRSRLLARGPTPRAPNAEAHGEVHHPRGGNVDFAGSLGRLSFGSASRHGAAHDPDRPTQHRASVPAPSLRRCGRTHPPPRRRAAWRRTVSPRNRGDSTQTITIAYPPIALPAVTVCAPAPRLLSPDVNPEYVGLDRAGLAEHLAWMGHSPRWRASVIELSRKRRLAAPDDVIASLKDRATARPSVTDPNPGRVAPPGSGSAPTLAGRRRGTSSACTRPPRRASAWAGSVGNLAPAYAARPCRRRSRVPLGSGLRGAAVSASKPSSACSQSGSRRGPGSRSTPSPPPPPPTWPATRGRSTSPPAATKSQAAAPSRSDSARSPHTSG